MCRLFIFLFGCSSVFSWFVLNDTNAALFFGVASFVMVLCDTCIKSNKDQFNAMHREFDDSHNILLSDLDERMQDVHSRIDEVQTSIHESERELSNRTF